MWRIRGVNTDKAEILLVTRSDGGGVFTLRIGSIDYHLTLEEATEFYEQFRQAIRNARKAAKK